MKKWYWITLSFILICFLTGFITRLSYRDDIQERILTYNYQSNDELDNVFNSQNIQSSDDIIKQADLIVKCHFSGTRQITDEAFYTPVKVTEVYKGNQELNGRILTVVEAVDIIENYDIKPNFFLISNKGFYIPLQANNDYYLFLKKISLNKARKSDEFWDTQYYPVSESAFGVYRVSNTKQIKLFDPQKEHTSFNKLSKFDIYATKQEQLDVYYQYKEQVFEKYIKNKMSND